MSAPALPRAGRRLAWGSLALLAALAARADRSSENMDPAYMYEKAKQFDKAAMYYHRALRGVREIYIAFHWNGDPANYAAGKYATEYVQLPQEFEERYKDCVRQGNLTPDEVSRIERLNTLWMTEMVDQEGGELRCAVALVAPVAEKLGDFRLAEFCRRAEVRYYQAVAIPFHERAAKELEQAGDKVGAALHREAIETCRKRTKRAERTAAGDKVLMGIPGLGGAGRYIGDLFLHPRKVNPVSFQYMPRRLYPKDERKRPAGPAKTAELLREQGLRHADESVRFAAVNTLAALGERNDLITALGDPSPIVRLEAAQALAAMRWANGWGACNEHEDPAVRATVAPLLEPAGKDVLARTWVVGELVRGLGSTSQKAQAFCQSTLERVTGKKMQPAEWAGWWKGLGNPQPGLRRSGRDVPAGVDETLDFGAWWQVLYEHKPNPLAKCQPPATILWDGLLVVPRSGDYQFFARNCGEKKTSANSVKTPGRMGFPGLYLSGPSVKVTVDGRPVLPHPTECIQDPCGGIRLDFGEPVRLEEGLHTIHVEFAYRSKRTAFWGDEPCLRLYWSSERFPRQVIPPERLVTKD